MKLRDDRLVLFVQRAHPWAKRQRISLADIAGRDMVVRERGSITREVFETRLGEAGLKPGTLIEVQTREAVREAVAAGFGIGVVFESEFGNDARFRPIHVADADLAVGEYVVCLEERRRLALVRTFIDIAGHIAAGRHAPAKRATGE